MGAIEELRNLVGQMKGQLINAQEIGFDTPFISQSGLNYLKKGPRLDFPSLEGDFSCNTLKDLEDFVSNCNRCKLSKIRKNLVFGEGPADARLVFIGEGPGVEEDLTGKPFVGEAGKLLAKIIKAMGLTREQVYICNIVKCHPPGNRDPELDEIEACLSFLKAQISFIRPEVICTLGRISAQSLINKDFKVTRDRGQWCYFMGIPLMPTYHPAYLLRNPKAKRQVWEDIQEIMKKLEL